MNRIKMKGRFSGAEIILENGQIICAPEVKRRIEETAAGVEKLGCGVFMNGQIVGTQKLMQNELTAYALINSLEPMNVIEGMRPMLPDRTAKAFIQENIEEIEEIAKFNPYHGYHGYFSTAEGATSVTARTKYGPGQKAIANIKAKATGEGLNKYPMGNTKQKNHKSADGIDTYLNDDDYPPKPDATTYRKVTKDLQISEEQAKAMAESIYRYASYDYKEIRASSRGENDSFKTEAENCEEFIKASPKWAGGKIYRGIKINNDADLRAIMDKASKGQPIDMRGISSWSTEQSIAEEFATDYSESGFIHSVVFVTNGTSTKNGTSVKHLSRYKDENEVLVSKDAVFTPTKIEAAGGTIYIYGNMP